MSRSQNDEESVILQHLPEPTGHLLDIGAYNGIKYSNTYTLIERGWHGVLVEPSPSVFVNLLANTAMLTDRVRLVNAAVSVAGGLGPFYDFGGDAISTLDANHRDKWQAGGAKQARKFFVQLLDIRELLNFCGTVEFISLDVEGTNWSLFQHLPWLSPALRLVCAEYENHEVDMRRFVAPHGWKVVHKTSENLIFSK